MKKFLLTTLSILLVFSMVACGNTKGEKLDKNESKTEVSTDKKDDVVSDKKLSAAERSAVGFITSIQAHEYDDAITYLHVRDTKFVRAEDLEWFIPRSSIAKVTEITDKYTEVTSKGGTDRDEVTIKFGTDSIVVKVELDLNNNWKVNFDEALIKNMPVKVAQDVDLYIGGILVDDTYREKTDVYDYYKIPAIVKRDTTVEVKNTAFGDFTTTILPNYDYDDAILIETKFSEEDAKIIYDEVKVLLDNLNVSYENGETSVDYMKYISTSASTDLAQILYDSVKSEYTWNSNYSKPTNIRYSIVKANNEKENPIILQGKDVIKLQLKIEKMWDTKQGNKDTTKVYGVITVQKTDNGYVVYAIDAENFISARNSTTRNWND